MEELIFRELWGDLVLTDYLGTYAKKELIYQDHPERNLKIYIYKESNHKRPHIHVIWKKEYEASFSIPGGVVLIGDIPNDPKKAVASWILKHQKELLKMWDDINKGIKPQLAWEKS